MIFINNVLIISTQEIYFTRTVLLQLALIYYMDITGWYLLFHLIEGFANLVGFN